MIASQMAQRAPIDDEEQLRQVGEMLVDIMEAERLLTRIHRTAVSLGDHDIVEHLDSEFFWKLRSAGDHLRDHFDLERVHGGHT